MSKQRHRRRSQGGTTPETTPQTGSGVAHFSVSEVVQFSMSVDKPLQQLSEAWDLTAQHPRVGHGFHYQRFLLIRCGKG